MVSVVGEPRRTPKAQDNVYDLIEPLGPGLVVDFEVSVLINHLATADAKIQAAIAQEVHHGGLLGHEHRVVEV